MGVRGHVRVLVRACVLCVCYMRVDTIVCACIDNEDRESDLAMHFLLRRGFW